MTTVRDRLWLFASRAHDDDIWLHRSPDYEGFTHWSRITPAEGALMLDVPNIIMIGSDGIPVPFSADAYGYAESFCRMESVVWSVTGSGGFRIGNEEDFICELAAKYPNVTGAFFDDFLVTALNRGWTDAQTVEMLRGVRSRLDRACRRLEMWLTLYAHDAESCSEALLEPFDCLSLWTWHREDLKSLPQSFEAMERRFPKQKKYLGVYIFDYPSGRAVPDESMELQCEYGLRLLREKRADGLIFLTNCVMGVGLPSELWLRKWIDRVKNEPLDE